MVIGKDVDNVKRGAVHDNNFVLNSVRIDLLTTVDLDKFEKLGQSIAVVALSCLCVQLLLVIEMRKTFDLMRTFIEIHGVGDYGK